MEQTNTVQTVKKEVKVGGTTISVTSVYKGEKTLERALRDWAIQKTLSAKKNP